VVTKDGKPQRVEVPVEMPEGVTYEGVFGDKYRRWLNAPNAGNAMYGMQAGQSANRASQGQGAGIGSGSGGGAAAGVLGGTIGGPVYHGQATPLPPASQQMTVIEDGATAPSATVVEKPTSERALLESKLHPALLEAFDCWKKSGQNCKQVQGKDGMVEVQLWLTDDSGAVLEQLKTLGFAMSQDRPKEKSAIGHLPAEKLADLAKISAVRFVSPARR
jgi:Ca-activated chloride channel family protein